MCKQWRTYFQQFCNFLDSDFVFRTFGVCFKCKTEHNIKNNVQRLFTFCIFLNVYATFSTNQPKSCIYYTVAKILLTRFHVVVDGQTIPHGCKIFETNSSLPFCNFSGKSAKLTSQFSQNPTSWSLGNRAGSLKAGFFFEKSVTQRTKWGRPILSISETNRSFSL